MESIEIIARAIAQEDSVDFDSLDDVAKDRYIKRTNAALKSLISITAKLIPDFDLASDMVARILAVLDGKNPYEPWPLGEDGDGIPGHVFEEYLSDAHVIVGGRS